MFEKRNDKRQHGKDNFGDRREKRSGRPSEGESGERASGFRREADSSERRVSEREDIVEGRNPVLEAIKSGRTIDKLYIAKGDVEGSIRMIIAMAKERGIIIQETDRRKLNEMSQTGSHQGVIAQVSAYSYSEVDDIIELAKSRNEDPFIIVLDEIEDPHNLGSIIRSANVMGAHGIIIPKRRSVSVTATVLKSAAGAAEYVKIAKVTNINSTLRELKDKGVWVIGADMAGSPCFMHNLTGSIAIVIGNEGSGLSKLVRDNCDNLVSIPVHGEIDSLNASVAAGVLMYEIGRQRTGKK